MSRWIGWNRLGWSVLLAVFALGFGITLATAQQVPETPLNLPTEVRSGAESSWVKICKKDEETGDKQACLVRYEGVDSKTGSIVITATVRNIEGQDKQKLLVNMPTSYSLMMPFGVQIKIDEDEPRQLLYAVCFPRNCQAEMDLSKEMLDQMRKGKRMFVAAMNAQQKTIAFPLSLQGFAKTSDGAPVDNTAYQAARRQMIQAAEQHQIDLAEKALEAKLTGQPPADETMVRPAAPDATVVPKQEPAPQ
ncbi:invasion associated locus B family protein [Methyloceanibacter sp.]|uniref:invasion associated locus B family protein n=1 Tax=Methyloceanibacter sp. TaxID=1965321 RepID=UPI003D6CA693